MSLRATTLFLQQSSVAQALPLPLSPVAPVPGPVPPAPTAPTPIISTPPTGGPWMAASRALGWIGLGMWVGYAIAEPLRRLRDERRLAENEKFERDRAQFLASPEGLRAAEQLARWQTEETLRRHFGSSYASIVEGHLRRLSASQNHNNLSADEYENLLRQLVQILHLDPLLAQAILAFQFSETGSKERTPKSGALGTVSQRGDSSSHVDSEAVRETEEDEVIQQNPLWPEFREALVQTLSEKDPHAFAKAVEKIADEERRRLTEALRKGQTPPELGRRLQNLADILAMWITSVNKQRASEEEWRNMAASSSATLRQMHDTAKKLRYLHNVGSAMAEGVLLTTDPLLLIQLDPDLQADSLKGAVLLAVRDCNVSSDSRGALDRNIRTEIGLLPDLPLANGTQGGELLKKGIVNLLLDGITYVNEREALQDRRIRIEWDSEARALRVSHNGLPITEPEAVWTPEGYVAEDSWGEEFSSARSLAGAKNRLESIGWSVQLEKTDAKETVFVLTPPAGFLTAAAPPSNFRRALGRTPQEMGTFLREGPPPPSLGY